MNYTQEKCDMSMARSDVVLSRIRTGIIDGFIQKLTKARDNRSAPDVYAHETNRLG